MRFIPLIAEWQHEKQQPISGLGLKTATPRLQFQVGFQRHPH